MDNLKVFENDEFGQLSVIVKNNKEYIEAIEVATILGYSNPRDAISRHCNEEGVVFSDVRVVTGIKKDNSKIAMEKIGIWKNGLLAKNLNF